jgi:hypothetical protein
MGHASLHIVGTGIKVAAQMTLEAQFHIQHADRALYLVADPATRAFILEINPRAESLHAFFKQGQPRYEAYENIVDYVLKSLRSGLNTCAIFYGHPGVFVYPSHRVIQRARAEGFRAVMLPGISAEDCLFADLGFDPGHSGMQSFETTDFLVYEHVPNTKAPILLWQIGVVGELSHLGLNASSTGLQVLTDTLLRYYPASHVLTLYEASQFAGFDANIIKCRLNELPRAQVSPFTTLLVPPCEACTANKQVLERLRMNAPRPRSAMLSANQTFPGAAGHVR